MVTRWATLTLNVATPTAAAFPPLSREYKFVISGKAKWVGEAGRQGQIHKHYLTGPACTADDFTSWSIRDELKSTECVLGIDTQFERKKGTAHCYIGSDYKRTVSELSCPCQASDFEW